MKGEESAGGLRCPPLAAYLRQGVRLEGIPKLRRPGTVARPGPGSSDGEAGDRPVLDALG